MTTSEGERDAEPKFGASLAPEALATKAEQVASLNVEENLLQPPIVQIGLPVGIELGQLVAGEVGRAGAPFDDPDNGTQHPGLARAIALAEGDQLACANLELHPVQHVRLAVSGAQVLDLQKLRHGGLPLPRRLGLIGGTEIARDHRGVH